MRIVVNYAIMIQFFMLQTFVYDSMMKEIPITGLMLTSYLILFSVSLIAFHFIEKKFILNRGLMISVWGMLIFLMGYLSVDNFLLIMPITKINTHSLNLTYTLAGLGALCAIPTAYVLKFDCNHKERIKSFGVAVGLMAVSGLLFDSIIATKYVFYITGSILMFAGIKDKEVYKPFKKVKLDIKEGTVLFLLILVSVMTLTLLKDFLYFNIGMDQIGSLLIIAFCYWVVSIIIQHKRCFMLKFDQTLLVIIFPIYLGYQLAIQANISFGSLIEFTWKRYYYVPSHVTIIVLLLAVVTLIRRFKKLDNT